MDGGFGAFLSDAGVQHAARRHHMQRCHESLQKRSAVDRGFEAFLLNTGVQAAARLHHIQCCHQRLQEKEMSSMDRGSEVLLLDAALQGLARFITYNAAIRACRKGQQWNEALIFFFSEMQPYQVQSNVITCNAVISATSRGPRLCSFSPRCSSTRCSHTSLYTTLPSVPPATD